MKFYALARYNGIAEPQSLKTGQSVQIPLTAEAIAAFEGKPPVPAALPADEAPDPVEAPPEVVTAPPAAPAAPEPPVPAGPDPAQVEQLHRDALNAYRGQDLDRAIALWDEVLALDPTHENARLYRSQAVSLKQKLSDLN